MIWKSILGKLKKEPKKVIWYRVTHMNGEYHLFMSIDDILANYPEMNRRGVEKVLSGEQKTHVTYRIEEECI